MQQRIAAATRLPSSPPRWSRRRPRRHPPTDRRSRTSSITSSTGSVGTEARVGLPVLAVAGAADRVRGQAAEPARAGLRAARVHVRGRAARPADRHVVSRPARVPLVGLNCATCHVGSIRNAPRRAAPDRRRHARQPDGPAGLRAVPHRVRQGSAVQRRHADRRDQEGEPEVRLLPEASSTASSSSAASRATASSSARRRTPGSTCGRRRVRGAWTRSILTRSCCGSTSKTIVRSEPSICRRCGTSASAKACGCTGTATTTRSGAEQERRHRRRRDARLAEARRRWSGSSTGFWI